MHRPAVVQPMGYCCAHLGHGLYFESHSACANKFVLTSLHVLARRNVGHSNDTARNPEVTSSSSQVVEEKAMRWTSEVTDSVGYKKIHEHDKNDGDVKVIVEKITSNMQANHILENKSQSAVSGPQNTREVLQQQWPGDTVAKKNPAVDYVMRNQGQAKQQKSKQQTPGLRYKVKKKAPWGHRQLRDMWSIDAMSRHDNDSVGERLEREYRYHPENTYRKHFRIFGVCGMLATPFVMAPTHYAVYGYPIWQGDPQFMFDMLRFHDTSPRSHLYFFHDPEVKKLGVPLPLKQQAEMIEQERKQFTAMGQLSLMKPAADKSI